MCRNHYQAITHIAKKDSTYLYWLCSTKGEEVVHNLFVHGLFNPPLKFSMPYKKGELWMIKRKFLS